MTVYIVTIAVERICSNMSVICNTITCSWRARRTDHHKVRGDQVASGEVVKTVEVQREAAGEGRPLL